MGKKIVYGVGRPHIESNFEIILQFILMFIYKTVKAVSSVIQRFFPNGIDGKKIIKE